MFILRLPEALANPNFKDLGSGQFGLLYTNYSSVLYQTLDQISLVIIDIFNGTRSLYEIAEHLNICPVK